MKRKRNIHVGMQQHTDPDELEAADTNEKLLAVDRDTEV